jgi:relaxase-like protein
MILKGNQRAFGGDLASHLLNLYENDDAQLVEIRGSASNDLHGAFAEFEAIATGTRCKEPLYSLSINPSEPMSRKQYFTAIERIEKKLDLDDQPRAIVFHVKNGREHCHVVWSRIDVQKMKAVQLSHDRQKLRAVAREIAQEFGHQLPSGLAKNRAGNRFDDNSSAAGAGEWGQAELSGLKVDDRRADITAAYKNSTGAQDFVDALEERGYFLARGDKRGFVVLDRAGQVHSLPRQINGARTKDVREKLAPLTPDNLPSVKQVRRRLDDELDDDALDEEIELALKRSPEELKKRQAERRFELQKQQQKQEFAQREERMALHVAHKKERDKPFARAARVALGMIERVPVLRTVLMPLMKKPLRKIEDQHRAENDALDRRYERESEALGAKGKAFGRIELREGKALRRDQRRIEKAKTRRGERRARKMRQMLDTGKEMTGTKDKRAAFRENADDLTDRQKEVKRRLEETEKRAPQKKRRPRGPGME